MLCKTQHAAIVFVKWAGETFLVKWWRWGSWGVFPYSQSWGSGKKSWVSWKAPFDRPVHATHSSACCLCVFVAKHVPGVGEDVARWVAGFWGKAKGLQPPAGEHRPLAGVRCRAVRPPKARCWMWGCAGTWFPSARRIWASWRESRD